MQIDALKVKAPYQASSDMEAENQKLHGIVSSLRTVVKHKDELEHQNLSLSVEMQMMRCSLDDLKSSSKKVCGFGPCCANCRFCVTKIFLLTNGQCQYLVFYVFYSFCFYV